MATTDGDLRDLLRRVPAFETLGENDLQRVAEVAVPRSFGRQEVIFREGDESDTCYIVRTGQARAVREHPDGRTITLARFGPGDIFGELAMFDDEKRSATVECVEDTEVVGILGTDMRRLMREHPDIAPKLVISLGRRLRVANERLARQSFQTVQSRVAVGAQRPRRAGERRGRRRAATCCCASRRRTSPSSPAPRGSPRAASWRRSSVPGVLTQGRGRIVVHDPGALAGYVY